MWSRLSIKVSYKDGVFEPLEKVEGAKPGKIYTVFSEEELRDIRETCGWLKAAETIVSRVPHQNRRDI